MKLITLIFVVVSLQLFSQNTVSGIILNENGNPFPGVLVINMKTDQQIFTNENGSFSIPAVPGNELRFLRNNYERYSVTVNSENYLKIILARKPEDIEEVIITYKPTGNLKEDIKHYGTSKKDSKLNLDLVKYNRSQSSSEVMSPKRGEFKQPKGPGFETSKKGYQWDKFTMVNNFQDIFGNSYFENLGIDKTLISSFIEFVLQDFETDNIRRFGRITSSDISKFQIAAEEKVSIYNKSVNKK
ncbi:carboxypeptidase-like regulatory domain-containing protein [Halpernia frigidisoli]|uniref:CarboxypepD_reg-like domain-containing protein n=1 Tax=Halpernia frigidisoli TaxID=1125876 RepID=A0A1I3GG16_9FLAO|nr:carboxypeptidase-like regulatory domain-containing protein [Halpernia frigidisoli]SFI22455.1 hypothetical protein SAMN05443292_1828 [Halpernia frigidisoli]